LDDACDESLDDVLLVLISYADLAILTNSLTTNKRSAPRDLAVTVSYCLLWSKQWIFWKVKQKRRYAWATAAKIARAERQALVAARTKPLAKVGRPMSSQLDERAVRILRSRAFAAEAKAAMDKRREEVVRSKWMVRVRRGFYCCIQSLWSNHSLPTRRASVRL
jgi:hypothetical protein